MPKEDEPVGRRPAATAESVTSGEKERLSPSPRSGAAGGSAKAVTMTQSLMNTFGPVSDLKPRLRDTREKVKSPGSDLQTHMAELDKVTIEQAETEARIAMAKESRKATRANASGPAESTRRNTGV